MKRLTTVSVLVVTLLLILQEMVPEVESARVRVVKVKKTRHDKRQASARGGYPQEVIGQSFDGSNNPDLKLKPEDNPYNAGNRKVDYPLLNQNQNNQFGTSNQPNRNFQNTPTHSQQQQNQQRRQQQQQQQQRQQQRRPSHNSGAYDGGDDHCEGCGSGIPGTAGTDYPTYTALPKTNFECKKQQWPGYYADTDARCQVFWICQKDRADAFLCPNGTLFNQQVFVCDWWFNVDCGAAPEFYSRNQYIYGGPGIDIFGNAVPIGTHQNTASIPQRARIPTNRPPVNTNFQQHAPPTVIPINTFATNNNAPPRPTNTYQTSIPIIQTTPDNKRILNQAPQNPSSNYRRATQTSSPRANKIFVPNPQKSQQYNRKTEDDVLDYPQREDEQYRQGQTVAPPSSTTNANTFNVDYDQNEYLERIERRLVKSESQNIVSGNSGDSDGGNSYANYIEAQKRLHLGSKYKQTKSNSGGRSYQQNPLISSSSDLLTSSRQDLVTSSRQQQQRPTRTYQNDNNFSSKQFSQSQSKFSGYDSDLPRADPSGTGYTTTTKRNALSPEEFDFPAILEDEDALDDTEGLKFNFAKMLLPPSSTTPAPTQPASVVTSRPLSQTKSLYRKLTYESELALPTAPFESDDLRVTTHRPFSRLIKISDPEQRLDKHLQHSQPVTYIQLPAPAVGKEVDSDITTPATPTFGKKIKSGKKRNVSNWTSYFHGKN